MNYKTQLNTYYHSEQGKHTTVLGRLVAPAIAVGLLMVVSCSTFKSDYYMQPRSGGGVNIKKAEWADYAEIRMTDFTFHVRVPVSGSTRHCIGPALFPVIPQMREWPQALKLEIIIAPKNPAAKIRIEPGKWTAHLRSKEFGKTISDDIYSDVRPVNVQFFQGTGPRTFESKGLPMWSRKGKTAPAQQPGYGFTGGVRAIAVLPPYDNQFVDFELRDVRVEVDGKMHDIPSIRFKRKSRWKYTPWTMRIFDM